MNTNLIIGALALAYGLVTLFMRFARPNSSLFGKLEPMKKQWGEGAGTAMHWVGYTILPLVAGAVMLVAELR